MNRNEMWLIELVTLREIAKLNFTFLRYYLAGVWVGLKRHRSGAAPEIGVDIGLQPVRAE